MNHNKAKAQRKERLTALCGISLKLFGKYTIKCKENMG